MKCPRCGSKTLIYARDFKGNVGYYCRKCRYSWVTRKKRGRKLKQ